MNDFHLELRPGALRGSFGRGDNPLPDFIQLSGLWVAHVVKNLGKIGHDIRRGAACGNHVVHARLLRNVFADQVGHEVH